MKLETFVLRYLLSSSMAVSALVFACILVPPSSAVPLAANQVAVAIWVSAPTTCGIPDDGAVCPQTMGMHNAAAAHSR